MRVVAWYSDGERRLEPCEAITDGSFDIPEDVWEAYQAHMDAHCAWSDFIEGAEHVTCYPEEVDAHTGIHEGLWWNWQK